MQLWSGTIVSANAYDIDAVRREWIGRVVAQGRGRYPVEYDPIRRHCHMVGDRNPLYLDPEAARAGPHGAVISPPTLIPYFAGNGPWPRQRREPDHPPGFTQGVPTPGDRGINMGTVWVFHRPARVGDRLSYERVVADVLMKPIRLDPMAVWIVTETRITNQDEMAVAVVTNTVLVHRSPEQIARDGSGEKAQ